MGDEEEWVKMSEIKILATIGIVLAVVLTSGCINQNEPVIDGPSDHQSEENEPVIDESSDHQSEEKQEEKQEEEEEEGIIERPTVEIIDVDIIELSVDEATIDITVEVHNPNPVGGTFNRISYTIYFKDERPFRGSGVYEFLGYSVNERKVTIETGPALLHIFFTLKNQEVLQALTTLAVQGQVWIKVVGTANLDLKAISYDIPFEKEILVLL